eukprot:1257698-Prymnesium_polylepis.1
MPTASDSADESESNAGDMLRAREYTKAPGADQRGSAAGLPPQLPCALSRSRRIATTPGRRKRRDRRRFARQRWRWRRRRLNLGDGAVALRRSVASRESSGNHVADDGDGDRGGGRVAWCGGTGDEAHEAAHAAQLIVHGLDGGASLGAIGAARRLRGQRATALDERALQRRDSQRVADRARDYCHVQQTERRD